MEEIEKEKRKKEELEKLKNSQLNKKRESFSNTGRNISNSQSEQISNYGNNRAIKEMSENSLNGIKKKTLRDSELDQEELIINDSNNNEIISIEKKNNFINDIDDNNMNDYQKIYDKEVSNKLKYELQKDLLNKQKKSYNMMILTGLRNKSEGGNTILKSQNDTKRNKLALLDLENKNDKKIKEIEQLLKGGVDDKKLMKLENTYKDNKEIMNIINNYKKQKLNLDSNNNLVDIPITDSIKIININRMRKSKSSIEDKNPKLTDNKNKIKLPKNINKANASMVNVNNYNQNNSSIQDFCDLSPFYYISNGNKLSKNMWGYNDKNRSNLMNLNNNYMTQEQIIQNKLKIYKDKMYKPFFDKVEKEKNKELKRLQILRSINDPTIKSNLETKFGIERGKVDLELTKEKEKINKAIKDYENELLLNENENQKALEQNNIFFD